jgi:hypothetical protein
LGNGEGRLALAGVGPAYGDELASRLLGDRVHALCASAEPGQDEAARPEAGIESAVRPVPREREVVPAVAPAEAGDHDRPVALKREGPADVDACRALIERLAYAAA